MTETKDSGNICTKLERIAELARRHRGQALYLLHHVIDVAWLHEAYRRTRKDAAVGVDGQTAEEYAANLEQNLQGLLERFRSGTYKAPPVRRVNLPKSDGRTRPIGIPTFEDKVLQRAVAMVLGAVYEQDFYDCSYGFRPGRSAHGALQALWKGLMPKGGWVLELDIQNFFDTLDHAALRSMLDQRVTDGVIRRALHKWLKAGVLEAGAVRHPDAGTPQGGVVSPILANIYLHAVLDDWFAQQVQPRLCGRALLIRYADDAVMVFEREDDARRVMDVLPKRFGKYGLTLHPEKTRLVRCKRSQLRPLQKGKDDPPPGTFDMLGFTHYWGVSRKGTWIVMRRTMRSRLARAIQRIREWCREHRHQPVAEQQQALAQKLRGHYGYYGITGNQSALKRFFGEVLAAWRWALGRRSQRSRWSWSRFWRWLRHHELPSPMVVHSIYRLAANP